LLNEHTNAISPRVHEMALTKKLPNLDMVDKNKTNLR
jgi:hypothetical protein